MSTIFVVGSTVRQILYLKNFESGKYLHSLMGLFLGSCRRKWKRVQDWEFMTGATSIKEERNIEGEREKKGEGERERLRPYLLPQDRRTWARVLLDNARHHKSIRPGARPFYEDPCQAGTQFLVPSGCCCASRHRYRRQKREGRKDPDHSLSLCSLRGCSFPNAIIILG